MGQGVISKKILRDIADYIRLRKGTQNTVLAKDMRAELDTIPTYEKGEQEGYDKGHTAGVADGIEQGKKAEYDAFWDAFQENGNRANYMRGFYRWPGTAFNPKYGIYGNILEGFSTSTVTSVKVPIVTGSNSALNAFYNCQNLVTIESINITGATDVAYMFYVCRALEEIRFEGTIERSLSFAHSSNLSADSVQSIIDHLKDLTGATAQTLTFHATVGGKLTQAQKDAISAKNWTLVY